jgi:hypothetical protein
MPDRYVPDYKQEARDHINATHELFNKLHLNLIDWADLSDSITVENIARQVDALHHDFTDFLEKGE